MRFLHKLMVRLAGRKFPALRSENGFFIARRSEIEALRAMGYF